MVGATLCQPCYWLPDYWFQKFGEMYFGIATIDLCLLATHQYILYRKAFSILPALLGGGRRWSLGQIWLCFTKFYAWFTYFLYFSTHSHICPLSKIWHFLSWFLYLRTLSRCFVYFLNLFFLIWSIFAHFSYSSSFSKQLIHSLNL